MPASKPERGRQDADFQRHQLGTQHRRRSHCGGGGNRANKQIAAIGQYADARHKNPPRKAFFVQCQNASACPGKVETGFPIRTCAKPKYLEPPRRRQALIYPPKCRMTASAVRNSVRSWPLRAASISPTGSCGIRQRQRNGAKVEEIDDRGVAQRRCIARGKDARIGDFRDGRRHDRRRRHGDEVERFQLLIHRGHQLRAPANHVGVIFRRHRAAALDTGADIGIDIGGTALHAVAVHDAGFRRRNAAAIVDRRHVVELRKFSGEDVHAGTAEPRHRRRKGFGHGVVQPFQRKSDRDAES